MRAPEPSSLASEAYQFVRQRILRGELPIGQVISRRKLAVELGMSFLPVSEALLRLEFEGLLESRPRAGTRVRIPSREDVRGHYIVREALEVQAAMLFASAATGEDRMEMRKLAARVDAMSVSEQSLYLPVHERLHRRIAEGARCPALSIAIEKTHALASTWFCAARSPSSDSPPRRHQELVDRLIAGDPHEAAEAMRQHVNLSLENTMRRLQPYFRLRKACGKTFFRSERRQKEQLIDPTALN
ncbi:MAG: GntR family transcriptional regulator [Acidobacteria bacterium]|nr:GntR family transcriptional regulator [Acidobacteriota bacterium]